MSLLKTGMPGINAVARRKPLVFPRKKRHQYKVLFFWHPHWIICWLHVSFGKSNATLPPKETKHKGDTEQKKILKLCRKHINKTRGERYFIF